MLSHAPHADAFLHSEPPLQVRASPEPTGGDPGKVIAMRKSKTATASRRAKARSRGYDNATECADFSLPFDETFLAVQIVQIR